jgi:hypothetical protein
MIELQRRETLKDVANAVDAGTRVEQQSLFKIK